MDVDVFEKSMGSLGRYQIWITFLILLTKFSVGWHLLNMIIIGARPTVTCLSPSNVTGCDPACESRFIDPSPFTATVQSQWELVCGDKYLGDFTQMFMMAGVMIGSFVFGVLADKIGRKWPLLIASGIQAVAATAIAYVPWLWLFLLLRFTIGLATGGQMTASFVLVMELIGKKWRVTIGTIYQMPTWFGHLSLAGIGYLLRDWRDSQLLIAIPSFFFLTYYWLLPESPRYLISAGRLDEAVAVMEHVATKNNLPTNQIASDVNAYFNEKKDDHAKNGQFGDLFRPKPICFRTLILIINWVACGVCFYGVAQYAGQSKGNIFANIATSAAMEIPGTFAAVYLLGKAGRKWTTILTCLISGIPMLVIPCLSAGTAAIPILALMAMFGIAGLFATVYVYSGELYPTFIRSIGVGFVSMTCRIGTISAPFIASLAYYDFAEWLPPVIFGIFPLVAGTLAYFLPETKDDKLAETLEDALNLGAKKAQDVEKPDTADSTKDRY